MKKTILIFTLLLGILNNAVNAGSMPDNYITQDHPGWCYLACMQMIYGIHQSDLLRMMRGYQDPCEYPEPHITIEEIETFSNMFGHSRKITDLSCCVLKEYGDSSNLSLYVNNGHCTILLSSQCPFPHVYYCDCAIVTVTDPWGYDDRGGPRVTRKEHICDYATLFINTQL